VIVASRLYETERDKAREGELMQRISEKFRCVMHKLPISWQIDAMIARDKNLVGFAELKCRNHTAETWDTVILSEHKTRKAFYFQRHLAKMDYTDAPFIFFVRFKDKDCYCVVTPELFNNSERKKLSAANHKDDPLDTEWVRYIDMKYFKEF